MSTEPPHVPLPRVPSTELHLDALQLAAEIDERLDNSDWQFAGEKETEDKGRLLLAAAMRHSARLLMELDATDGSNLIFDSAWVFRRL